MRTAEAHVGEPRRTRSVDRHAGSDEQQRLEQSMRDQVGDRDRRIPRAHSNDHEPVMSRRRSRKQLLRLRLDSGDDTARERSGQADTDRNGSEPGNRVQRWLEAGEQVGTGGHHRRRVQQRRCRRRT